jgi:hypothetical protein
MRRQDELDRKRRDSGVQPLRGNPGRDETSEAVGARTALRRGRGLALIGTPPTDAMVLLGDVGEVQKMGERASDRQGGCDRQPRELARQDIELLVVTRMSAFRERPDTFNGVEQVGAAVGAQRLAEKFTEKPNIIP